jgi:hypothetical protein
MKANVHEFIVLLILYFSLQLIVSRCSLISLTATSVGL